VIQFCCSEQVLPTVLEELVELASKKVASFLKQEYEKITKELAQVCGFITVDIKVKEEEIVKRLKHKIESDNVVSNKDLESFIKKIEDMKEDESST
jgi:pyruvate-formate lyase-activating enzyme